MAIIYQTSTNNLSLFKVALISSGVFSAAIMLTATDFVDHVPSIYNGVVSWLRPPYLYLVINCIIISIVASSKLHSAKGYESTSATSQPFADTMAIATPPPVKRIETVDYSTMADNRHDGVVLDDSSGYEVKVEKGLEFDSAGATKTENLPFTITAASGGGAFGEDAMSNKENEYVLTKPTWSTAENNGLTEHSPSIVKPSVSARFSHRRNGRASPEGGRTVLGVSKPKRQDTLESTWKTITEGRPIPITRHLKKSDTWEREGHSHGNQPEKTMKKAETFNHRSTNEGGKLKKEASLSQDELNRRVEAFIKKFNEDMRLQRQESLNQYKEMINRGSN